MNHFLDVGGNEGQTLDWIEAQGERFDGYLVWIFEPSPRHWTRLMEVAGHKSRVWANDRSDRKIILCPFGLTGITDIVQLFEKDDPKGDSLYEHIRSDHVVNNLPRSYRIAAHACGIIQFFRIQIAPQDRVTMVLDCEGSEVPIMDALCDSEEISRRIDTIMVEWHTTDKSKPTDGPQVTERLRSFGIEVLPWVL